MIRLALATTEPLPFAERVPDAAVERCPPDDEAALARRLAAGTHVVLTAPPALPWPSVERLAVEAQRSGARLGLLNPDRFLPSRQLLRREIETGTVGQPGLVRIHRWCGGGRGPEYLRDLDVAIWLVGQMPSLVYALENDRALQIHLGFPDGAMALIDVAELPAGDGYRSMHLVGSTGAAYADDQQNAQLLFRGGQARALPVGEGGSALLALTRAAAATLAAGRDLSTTLDDWRSVAAVAESAGRSIAAHQPVPLAVS